MAKKTILESARRLPVIGKYDVVVIGGGFAGTAAAVSAARNGAKTCLIEKQYTLGGLATLGNVWFYLPICDGYGRQVIGGMGEEFLKASVKYGGGQVPACWKRGGKKTDRLKTRYATPFSPDSCTIALDELCLTAGVTLHFDTRVCNVVQSRRRISAIIVENKGGRSAIACETVIDASGDADVCFLAGEATRSRNDNSLACWAFYAVGEKVLRRVDQDWPIGAAAGRRTYRGDVPDDVTKVSIETRKTARGIIRKLRRENPGKDVEAVKLPGIPLFRMTRRLRGLVELQERQVHKWFPDTIGLTGSWLENGPVYAIPLRSLIGSKVDNLLAAGRCISVAGNAWDVTRAIPACVMTGQAAGTAAAMAAANGRPISRLDVAALQQRLKDQKVILDPKLVIRSTY